MICFVGLGCMFDFFDSWVYCCVLFEFVLFFGYLWYLTSLWLLWLVGLLWLCVLLVVLFAE